MKIEFEPIGLIETCFSEKFGVPRQSLMVKEAFGKLTLLPEFSNPNCVLHLDGFSHVWLIYHFHKSQNENHPAAWTPTIQPPRIDAPKRVGVFASRSPHRPNPIGMSVVKLEGVQVNADRQLEILVSGVDLLDGTPILDLKPYLPYADSIPNAGSGWIRNEILRYEVVFSEDAEFMAEKFEIKDLIIGVLEWDPRPRSQREQSPIDLISSIGKNFALRVAGFDVHWEIGPESTLRVLKLIPLGGRMDP